MSFVISKKKISNIFQLTFLLPDGAGEQMKEAGLEVARRL